MSVPEADSAAESREQLREQLIDLECLRVREARARQETEMLLDGLRLLSHAVDTRAMFAALFDLLRQAFAFDDVILLQAEASAQGLRVIQTTDPCFAEPPWQEHRVFRRVLEGEVVASFDVMHIPEWQARPEARVGRVVSAIHSPIGTLNRRGILIGTQGGRAAFDQGHVQTMRRIVHLVEQAWVNAEARASLLREAELACRRDELQAMVDARTADLVRARDAAERANAARGCFFASMSHELRTPLHAILSFADLATRGLGKSDRAKTERYLRRIATSGRTLLVMVNQLLDLAKMEAGRMRFEFAPVEAAALIEDVAGEFECLAQQGRVEMLIPGGACTVVADRDKLRQLMRNLIGNGLKFAPPDSRLEIGCASADGQLQIRVDDAGPGVPEDERDSVFQAFTQAKNNRHHKAGTGLGLAICREIAAAHGGSIWVEESPAGGASFRVRLPLAGPPGDQAMVTASDR